MERRGSWIRWLALGLSLGVHLCVLALTKPPPPPAPTTPRSIELTELTWIDTTPPEPPPPSEAGPVTRKPPSRKKPSATPPPPPTSTPLATPPPAPVEPDVPRAIDLTRATEGITLPGLPGGADDAPRGRTLRPSDLPSDEERLADEHARVSERVGTWVRGELAQARVRGGLPDPSYGQLGADLRAATDDVPKFIDTNSPKEVVGALMQSWGAGAERYGKTGAPYAEPEGRLENVERPSALGDAAMKGSPDAIATANFLAAGARLQEFADGRAGLELYALVEVRQTAAGQLESVTLKRPSGLRPFDTWVTERARQVGLAFSFDGGARTRALRSVWRFDGIILYRRKLKLSELDGRAAVGMVAMGLLSALSSAGNTSPIDGRPLGPRMPGMVGRFDELTGELDMVDLTNPTYDCRVTLLEAD